MKTRLRHLWELVGTSFWFVPALGVLFASGLAFIMVAVDRRIGSHGLFGSWFTVGPEGARSVLSTIAGSMITVAGVTFSITMVTLTLASSQFGPRLLRNFMQDKGNQVVLGTFVATFVYCLLVLRSVHAAGERAFVPSLAVNLAIVLALANLGILIYFIHHVSISIQADRVVAAVYDDLEKHMQRLFPEELGHACAENDGEDRERIGQDRYRHIHPLVAADSGYLQAIDGDHLVRVATENDLVVQLSCRPGAFMVAGGSLGTVRSVGPFDEDLEACLGKAFIIGAHRTPEQDAEFTIHQLVEIAVRALSPGVNDPFTAIACVDRLGAALCFLANRNLPSPCRYDDDGSLRIVAKPPTFAGFTAAAFDQIRQHGRSSAAVTMRLLETLRVVAAQTRCREQWRAIRDQAIMIERGSAASLQEDRDREDVTERYHCLMNVLSEREQARPGAKPHPGRQ